MSSGGPRVGAGRKQGEKAPKTLAREAAKQKFLASEGVTAQRVIEEICRCAFVDARTFWNDDGTLKRINELTPEQGAALAGFEAIIKNAAAGDDHQDTVHKIKLWDKPRNLEMLAKHFALLTDVVRHEVDDELKQLLKEGRARNAKTIA